MKLHDLRPADGSRQPRTRVGRGIAAGKGKTAGRGTKGQKARAGGSIPPWFEGGQTPLHMRIPKLRGFTNRFRIEYEIVNIGAIDARAAEGAFEVDGGKKPTKAAPITINQDILRAVGLVRTLNKPLKILGSGELSVPLFVVADAFTASARAKIEAAGGSVNVLEMPASPLAALGVTREPDAVDGAPATAPAASAATKAKPTAKPSKALPAKPAPAKTAPAKATKAAAPDATDDADHTAAADATESTAVADAGTETTAATETDESTPATEAETPSRDDA